MNFALAVLFALSTTIPLADLRKAPTEIVIDGQRITLTTSLWRDFMPTMPPAKNGHALTAVLSVQSSVRIESVWMVRGKDVWKPSQIEEQDLNDPTKPNLPGSPVFRVVVRGGPKWGPGTSADVIVRVKDRRGRFHLLRAEKQGIGRVD
jgi:hypothetical protein